MQDRKRFSSPALQPAILTGLFLVLSSLLAGQKIPLDSYTIQNGLPQNTVNDIAQDHSGYLWFATQVGAARFDGYEFTYFNFSNGLPDDFVNCLLVDGKGNVWMGTEGGIAVFSGTDFRWIRKEDGLADLQVYHMLEDRDGNTWVGTPNGLSVVTPDTIISYTKGEALTGNSIYELFADSRGKIHVSTNSPVGLTVFRDPYTYEKIATGGLVRDMIETASGEIWYATQGNGILVDDGIGPWRRIGYPEGLPDETVLSLMEDRQGRVWVGTYTGGPVVFENGSFREFVMEGLKIPVMAAIKMVQDSKGRIWIRTPENGVWLFDQGAFSHLTVASDLVHNQVQKIFEDSYGSVWFATLGGVSKYGRVVFEVYDRDTGLPEDHITSVFRDSRGRIWFGTYEHLMYKQGNDIAVIDQRSGFPEHRAALSFAEDARHQVYIGTDLELLRYNGRSVVEVERGAYKFDDNMNSLLYAPDGRLWCASDSGVMIIDGQQVSLVGRDQGLIHLQVNDLDEAGNLVCCATEGGISLFDVSGKHVSDYSVRDGLVSDVCIDATHDAAGNFWVATNRGVSRIVPGEEPRITSFSTGQGLTSNNTYFVAFTDSVSLWIGTERGINVLDTRSGEIRYYGIEEGFLPLETNARAVANGPGGGLWIGTVGGLVHYRPAHDVKNPRPPDLILFPPLVNGTSFMSQGAHEDTGGLPEEPSLPYNKNSLTFSYTGIHTILPGRNRFSYYLDGFDDGWSAPSRERSVSYKKLPSGSFVFRVRAFNPDGVETPEAATFAFTIRPPFWRTAWFIMLEVLTGLLLVYGIIKYRERQLVREKKILEKKVRERTREIEDQKLEIETQRDKISEQKLYVEQQRDRIVLQNKEITDSIHYAKRIQQAVLPGIHTLERTLPGHFILFRPRDIVSGDFYWVEEHDGLLVICAADCTGHGVPGAFMSLLGLTFLNEIVNKDGILDADKILNRLRTYIIRAVSPREEDSQTRDGMDLSLVVIDREKDRLEFAGAYNPLVLVRNGELIEYRGDKMPIGKHVGKEVPFTRHQVVLEAGDMLYLFTDGYRDQFGGEDGSKFKARPFKRLLQRISAEPVMRQYELLNTELNSWMKEMDQVDDILVMGIRYLKDKTA
jgi:ligand-binding sensor domain-containing protein/serine phosphatase RsbU (regulator of sigma subunit)